MPNKSSRLPLFGLLLIAALLLAGLAHLFHLRFAKGDVYPAYSSLRSDPLGARVFYSSLGQIEDLSVERNHRPLHKLDTGGKPSTLFFLGLDVEDMKEIDLDSLSALESWVRDGGRLVLTAAPVLAGSKYAKQEDLHGKKRERRGTEGKPSREEGDKQGDGFPRGDIHGSSETIHMLSLEKAWGFQIGFAPPEQTENMQAERAQRQDLADLPSSISWHTVAHFEQIASPWQAVYLTRETQPVVIERSMGKGTIVLSTDSYLLSNEAMRKERHADLLAWFVGHGQRIIFDESQHGVAEKGGVMVLARKYNLEWVLAGLLLLAALFIWKNSSGLVPAYESSAGAQNMPTRGQDSVEGLVNLLRRSIPENDILRVCFEEWRKTVEKFRRTAVSRKDIQRMSDMLSAEQRLRNKERDTVNTYNAMCAVLEQTGCLGKQKEKDEADKEKSA